MFLLPFLSAHTTNKHTIIHTHYFQLLQKYSPSKNMKLTLVTLLSLAISAYAGSSGKVYSYDHTVHGDKVIIFTIFFIVDTT